MTLWQAHRALYTDYNYVNISSICLSICVSIYLLFVYLSIYSSIYLSPYLPIHLCIHPSVYIFVCLSISQNGKLRDMCEDIWHVPTRDSQCRSVQPVSLVVFWTDQNPCDATSQLPLKSVLLPLDHSRNLVHLLTEQNVIYWGWFWIFFGQIRQI